jgi:hypothetical protein
METTDDIIVPKPAKFESYIADAIRCYYSQTEIPKIVFAGIRHLDIAICKQITSSVIVNDTARPVHKMLYRSTLQLIIDMLAILTDDFPFCTKAQRAYDALCSFTVGERTNRLVLQLKKQPVAVVQEVIRFYQDRLEDDYDP